MDFTLKRTHKEFEIKKPYEGPQEIEILSMKGDTIEVLMKGFDVNIVNTIRRIIMMDLPTLSIHYATYNNPPEHPWDAHSIIWTRLGLIPFYTDSYILDRLENFEDCGNQGEKEDEEIHTGCRNCGVPFTIRADYESANPRGKKKNTWMLYSGDIKIEYGFEDYVKPVADDIPIMMYNRGQTVEATGWLRKGYGSQAEKWSPVSVAFHEEVSPNVFKLTVESHGCYELPSLFTSAMTLLIKKVESLEKEINQAQHLQPEDSLNQVFEVIPEATSSKRKHEDLLTINVN